MYSNKEALALSDRYTFPRIDAIRSSNFKLTKTDKRWLMGTFASLRRALRLKAIVRHNLIDEQHAHIRRNSGGWTNGAQAEFVATRNVIDGVEDSLRGIASMIIIVCVMIDGMATSAERAAILDLYDRKGIPDNATMLQAIVAGHTKDELGSWVHSHIRQTAERQGLGEPLVEFMAGLVDQSLYGKLQDRAKWIEREWRQSTINLVFKIRRSMRKAHETRAGLRASMSLLERELRKNPASVLKLAPQIECYGQHIRQIGNDIRAHAARLRAIATRIDLLCPSLAEKAEVFNCNVADLRGVPDDVDTVKFLCVESLEDSAMHRGSSHLFDHVLGSAMMEIIIDRLYESPEGRDTLREGMAEHFPLISRLRKVYVPPEVDLTVDESSEPDDAPPRLLH